MVGRRSGLRLAAILLVPAEEKDKREKTDGDGGHTTDHTTHDGTNGGLAAAVASFAAAAVVTIVASLSS